MPATYVEIIDWKNRSVEGRTSGINGVLSDEQKCYERKCRTIDNEILIQKRVREEEI